MLEVYVTYFLIQKSFDILWVIYPMIKVEILWTVFYTNVLMAIIHRTSELFLNHCRFFLIGTLLIFTQNFTIDKYFVSDVKLFLY